MKYLPLEAAAFFINPEYKQRSIYTAMKKHVESGNFSEYYPEIAIIDADKNVMQVIGESEKPFYKVSELKEYKEKTKIANMKNGHSKKVKVKTKGIEQVFDSIQQAAEKLGLNYYEVYRCIDKDKEIRGYRFFSI